MTNHSDALTQQVFTFASELYAYGVREVVIVRITINAASPCIRGTSEN